MQLIIEDPKEQFESRPDIGLGKIHDNNRLYLSSPKATQRDNDNLNNSLERDSILKNVDSLAEYNLLQTNRNLDGKKDEKEKRDNHGASQSNVENDDQ